MTEQLGLKSQALTDLAVDWRKLLFPNATDQRFADGYAQAVTFGMLMARAKGIALNDGLDKAAAELSRSSTLIGAAPRRRARRFLVVLSGIGKIKTPILSPRTRQGWGNPAS